MEPGACSSSVTGRGGVRSLARDAGRQFFDSVSLNAGERQPPEPWHKSSPRKLYEVKRVLPECCMTRNASTTYNLRACMHTSTF